MVATPPTTPQVAAAFAGDLAVAEMICRRLEQHHMPATVIDREKLGDRAPEGEGFAVMVAHGDYDRAIESVIQSHQAEIPTTCPKCLYTLVGIHTSGCCPECGEAWPTWTLMPRHVWIAPRPTASRREPAITSVVRVALVVMGATILLAGVVVVSFLYVSG